MSTQLFQQQKTLIFKKNSQNIQLKFHLDHTFLERGRGGRGERGKRGGEWVREREGREGEREENCVGFFKCFIKTCVCDILLTGG